MPALRRLLLVALLCGACLLVAARPAAAQFRGDEVEPRKFKYGDDYFINVFSYRQRLTWRWRFGDAADVPRRWFWSAPWSTTGPTALGYDITAGSLTNDDLYLRQQAVVRLPFTDFLGAEYRFLEAEDHDARYRRNEVELLFRFLRPDDAAPLLQTLGHTPAEDGLFLGGLGLLDSFKENADVGLVAGWRGDWLGLRLDVIRPDYFYDGKAELGSEYEADPLTLRGKVGARLGDLELLGWVDHDLPLRLSVPVPDALTFRFRQLTGGLRARWAITDGVRVDLDASGERTRKSRRATSIDDDTEREAFSLFASCEVDVDPLFDRPRILEDTLLLGVHVNLLRDVRDELGTSFPDVVERRGEAYGEVGYLLSLPAPHEQLDLALRTTTQAGFASLRLVRQGEGFHSVTRKLLAKLGVGLEASFRDGQVLAFFQLTFRLDDQTFGGGNGQVMMVF